MEERKKVENMMSGLIEKDKKGERICKKKECKKLKLIIHNRTSTFYIKPYDNVRRGNIR